MTDLHTHILPGVDDGAKTVKDSLTMLRAQYEQGVDTVVLTPHFYPDREDCASFLRRRKAAWEHLLQTICALPQQEQLRLPRIVLGAEVAYVPGLQMIDHLAALCIGNTKNMLLELPFYLWDQSFVHQLYDFLGRAGVTPVLAHIDRYFAIQKKKTMEEVLDLGLPVQVGTETVNRPCSVAIKLLKQGKAHFLASDCHDMNFRAPNLRQAMLVAQKKLGQERCEELIEMADQLTAGE